MQSPYLKARKNAKRAFTLIELLVVVLIIGVLLAIAIPLYLSSVKNAAIGATKANMRMVAMAGQALYVKDPTKGYTNKIGDLSGAGLDLPPAFAGDTQGPKGVKYSCAPGADPTHFIVTATEGGQDVFGDPAKTDDTATFDLATNIYSGIP